MSTILTAAGESLIARLQAEGKALVIDTMILANVPGQDHTQAIAPGVSVPEEAQIALRYAIPPQYRAYVNPNQVVYSAMLGSDMGDFIFNWQGLWCSEHETLVAVATFPALEKRRYDEANGKTGNNLTRNFLLTFTGARELTGLTISADVWQLDFTVRLNGMDERERLSNFDIYGQAFFDADGWLLQKTADAYAFAPGLGYVGGIRTALAESLPLAAPESANLPQNVWLDVCLKHTGSDRVAEALPMLAAPAAPLADSAADETGLLHYRALVARIESDGSVTDLRNTIPQGLLPYPDRDTLIVADKKISVSRRALRIPIWLTANRTWYVNGATGNDANTGDSASTAFKSITAAIQHVTTYYNIGDFTATIDIAEGTYNEQLVLPSYARRSGYIVLFGRGGVTITQSERFVVTAKPMAGEWLLQGVKLSCVLAVANSSYAESGCIEVASGALVHLVSVAILGTRSSVSTNRSMYLVRVQQGGEVRLNPGCSITSSATLPASWPIVGILTEGMVWLFGNGQAVGAVALTINGSFTATLMCAPRGYFRREPTLSPAIAGSVTGQRYVIEMAGICYVNGGGANYFPGSTAGVVNSNGVYA